MKQLIIELTDIITDVVKVPIFGTALPRQEKLKAGTYYLPKCATVIEIDSASNVCGNWFIPSTAILEEKQTKREVLHNTSDGVSEDLLLKTIALLTDKESLVKMIE